MALTVTITGDASGVDIALARLQGAVEQRMSAVEARLGSGEQHTRQFSERSQRHIESLQKSFDGLQATISRVQGILASFGAGIGLGALAKGAVEAAGTFEQLDTQLKFVVKSMEEFQQARQFIIQFTATTPFQLGEVTKAFIDLTRRGFDVQRTLKAIGDAASLQQYPSQAFERIVFQLGQVADRAKLTGDNLRDLSTSGLSIGRVTEELQAMGVVIKGDIGDASVSAAKGIEAITRVFEKDFKDAMLATAGNWKTVVSNLVDNWTVFEDFLVRGPILDFLKGLVGVLNDDMNRAITDNQTAVEAFGASAVASFKSVMLSAAGLADLFYSLLAPLAQVQTALGNIEQAIGNFLIPKYAALLQAVARGAEILQVPTETVEALRKTAETILQRTGGKSLVQAVVGETGPAAQAIDNLFQEIDRKSAEQRAKSDAIIKQRQAENAKTQRQLSDQVRGDDSGSKAAANKAAKEQEQIIQQSLKRQEALIAQSFDERRVLADELFTEEIRKAPGEADQIGKQRIEHTRLLAQEEATLLEQVRLDSNNRQIASAEEHGARQEAIFAKTAAVRQQLSKQATDEEIKDLIRANDLLEKAREQGLEDFSKQTRNLEAQMEREQAQIQASQLRSYENFVNRIAGMLNDIFTGLLDGTLKAVDFFKRLLIAQLSNIASSVLAPIVASISSTVVRGVLGSLGGTAGGSSGGILDTLLTAVGFGGSLKSLLGGTGSAGGGGLGLGEGVGILGSLKTIGSGFTTGLGELTKSMLAAASTISRAFGGPTFGILPPGVQMEGVVNVGAGSAVGAGLSIAGGLAALGTGIYAALNASNNAAKAAYAASAAAGAFAAGIASYAAITGTAAAATAGGTGWTGIGLIVAAAMAVVGIVLDKVIKPEGPTLAVGAPRGIRIGASGGRLGVGGDAGAQIFRQDKVDPAVARGVQAQMEAGITSAVMSVLDMINAVALNPEALLGPTQAALERTLASIQTLNSSNAKKMEKDIAEQLRFINAQVVAGMLEPVELAFNQLRDIGTLEEQLQRLPGTTAGLVQVFKTMNEQLTEIGKSENTDVLRQLSAVKGKVELFGNRIAETAGQVADRIVTGIVERFQMQVVPDLAGQITQFSDLMKASFPALGVLRATQKTLEEAGLPGGGVAGQLGRLSGAIESATQQLATRMVTGILDTFSTAIDTTLAGEITQFTTLMSESFQALGFLRSAQKTLEQAGLSGAGIAGQLGRLTQGMEDTAKRLSIQMVSGLLEAFGEQVDTDLAGQITRFSELMGDSLQALGFLRAAQQGFEQQGLAGAGIGEQIVRLMQGMAQTAATISSQLVTTAMQGLSANLDRVLIQPLRVQATTVTSVFTDSLAALQALTVQRVSLSGAGVDVSAIERQIERLVGALLTTSMEVFTRAFSQGDFATFLDVLAGIPESIMALNPAFQRLQQLGALFGEVVGPNVQKIIDLQDELRSTGERVAFTGGRITELAEALRQAGGSAEASLPLYKQLADVLTANAEARIAAVHEIADMERDALATRVEGYRKALDEWVQAEQKALDLWVETQSQALDEWVKTATKQLDAWVDTMTKAVNDWADSARTTADQLKTVNDILFQEKSPAAQQAELEAEKARLIGVVQGGGPDAGAALTRLIDVQRGLLEVAKRGDDLGRQRKILDELEGYRKLLTDRLIKETGESDPFFAQLKIQREQEQWLKAIAEYQTGRQEEIHRIEETNRKAIADYETFHRDQIFQAQAKMEADIAAYEQLQLAGIEAWEKEQVRVIQQELIVNLQAINSTLAEIFKKLPGVPELLNIQDRQAAQRGGIIGLASGAYVPALLEPGERVFNPPLAGAQKGALVAMNRAFPRFAQGGFTVPGSGSGDTVPAMLPRGSFVLNRRASGAMGYQGGGTVSGGSAPVVNIHIAKLEVRNDADIKAIIDGITKQLRREWRSSNNSGPFR